jgi:hypothetical protein
MSYMIPFNLEVGHSVMFWYKRYTLTRYVMYVNFNIVARSRNIFTSSAIHTALYNLILSEGFHSNLMVLSIIKVLRYLCKLVDSFSDFRQISRKVSLKLSNIKFNRNPSNGIR